MAARLQVSAPELLDLKSEGEETLDLYGCDPAKPSFARACLLARRMVEVEQNGAGWSTWSVVRRAAADRTKWKNDVQTLCASWHREN